MIINKKYFDGDNKYYFEKMKIPNFLSQFDSRGPHLFENNVCVHCKGSPNTMKNLYNCSGNPKW